MSRPSKIASSKSDGQVSVATAADMRAREIIRKSDLIVQQERASRIFFIAVTYSATLLVLTLVGQALWAIL